MLFILAFIVSLVLTITVIPMVVKISKVKFLFDTPDFRKKHKHATPTMGGIGILVALVVSLLLFGDAQFLAEYKMVIGALLFLSLTGIADDLIEVSAKFRLVLQAAVGSIFYFSGFALQSDYGLLGIGVFHPLVAFLVTVFAVVLFINAFNFIDGINGLSGTYGLFASLIMIPVFYLSGNMGALLISIVLSAALIGFLRFNFGKAKIFMGDSGSLLIGALLILQAISFVNNAFYTLQLSNALPMVLAIMALPAIDIVRVVIGRLINGKSAFSPDRTHIHHLLVDNGFSHQMACYTLITMCAIMLLVAQFALIIGGVVALVLIIGIQIVTTLSFTNLNFLQEKVFVPSQAKVEKLIAKASVLASFFF